MFLEPHLGRLLRCVPVREGHVLQLDWDMPPTDELYNEAPSNYLSHLLGHEGDGSAFAALKARGWASALSAAESGNSISSRGFFYVRIDLTGGWQLPGSTPVWHLLSASCLFALLLACWFPSHPRVCGFVALSERARPQSPARPTEPSLLPSRRRPRARVGRGAAGV